MVNKKFVVELSGAERERLREVISRGKAKAKSILKARILLKVDQGWADAEICRALDSPSRVLRRVSTASPMRTWRTAFASCQICAPRFSEYPSAPGPSDTQVAVLGFFAGRPC